MLGNIGRESEMRDQNKRARGRRHGGRDEATVSQPAYLSAPYATGLEQPRAVQLPRKAPEQQLLDFNGEPGYVGGMSKEEEEHVRREDDQGRRYMHEDDFPWDSRQNEYEHEDYAQNGTGRQYAPLDDAQNAARPDIDNHGYTQEDISHRHGMPYEGKQVSFPRNMLQEDSHQLSCGHKGHVPHEFVPACAPAAGSDASRSPGLRSDRVTRGGLNLFSWNTEAPIVPPPRVLRERDNGELQRLRPQDPHSQRDTEVREKFEGNTNSRFLCFSEMEQRRQKPPRCNPHLIPGAPVAHEPPRHGRRRSNQADAMAGDGIAGFAGMGNRSEERAYHNSRRH